MAEEKKAPVQEVQGVAQTEKKGGNAKAGFITQFLSSAISTKSLSTIGKLSDLELSRAKKALDALNSQFQPIFAAREEQMQQAVADFEAKEAEKAERKAAYEAARAAYRAVR